MNLKAAKAALLGSVRALSSCKWSFAKDPEKHFTRHRKLPFEKLILSILALQGGTLDRELLDIFGPSPPSSSAFVQQRAKLRQETFETLFAHFTDRITERKTLNGLRVLAVDGSSLRIPPDPKDPDSFYPGVNGQKPYSLLHINALFDLAQNIYVDAIVQKAMKKDEFGAMTDMVDRSGLSNALFIADRGYESYNVMAHIQEKKCFFLIRVKDAAAGITSSLTLPDRDEFDVPFHLTLLNKHSVRNIELLKDRDHYKFIPRSARFDFLPPKTRRSDPGQAYKLFFRVVRFRLNDGSFESVLTNLPADEYPPSELKRLYSLRWNVETSFRNLKYSLALTRFHSKKAEFILQEIFAKLIMHNFSSVIIGGVTISQGKRKYAYKVSFTVAVLVCRDYFLNRLRRSELEALLLKHILPVRPGRSFPRKTSPRPPCCFLYRTP